MESLGHLLRTNQAPNDDERGRLKETLAGNDETLSAITEKISALEEQLRSLNEEKAALLEASAPVRWALSSFRQLPEDIVRAIFVACLETRWNPTMANTEAPVLLTQISRATRMIALTTPELWAAIHIPILVAVPLEALDAAESIMTARTEGVKEWLRRSRNLPLSISVYEKLRVRGATHSLRYEIADALIGVLAACCSRWKNMHFSCRSTTLSQLASLNELSVPLLRSLGIFSSSSSDDEEDLWRDSGILKAPMLTRFLQLGSTSVSTFPIKWSSLTHLHCIRTNTYMINELAHVLRQATGLVRLDLNVTALAAFSIGTISLPHLTTLVIIEVGPNPTGGNDAGIFGSIHAPSLEIISYNADRHGVQRSPALIACLKNSSNIREVVTGRPLSLDILVEYLSHCPSLRILNILAPDYYTYDGQKAKLETNIFFDHIAQDDPTQCLCPQLEYFRFDAKLPVSLPTLRNFLVRRNGTAPGLRRLKGVIANVIYDPVEEPLIKEIQSAEVARDIRLEVSFKKSTGYQGFDLGIDRTSLLVGDWWPSGTIVDMTYLR